MRMLRETCKENGILGQGILEMNFQKIELPDSVKNIISVLEENGFEAYAVGGCVRDSLLGKEPKDWDITTSARPEQVKALFKRTIDTGIKHGTVTVMMQHTGYEVTTYRIDGKYEDGRHPKEVMFTPDLVEDLKRRDFTVNAMAYSDRTGIVDEFNGMEDLKNGIIRCVGTAGERFTEDALRILRAVRFSAQLGFEIEEGTMGAVIQMADTLKKISRERIQAELDKLIMSDHPECVRILETGGILNVIFSDCGKAESYGTVEELAEKLCMSEQNHFLRWAVFISYMPFQGVLQSLKFDNKTIHVCGRLRQYRDEELHTDKPYVRHLIVKVGKDIFRDYLAYRRVMGNVPENIFQAVKKVYDEILEAGDCLSLKELKVNGRDLIANGVKPGTQMGEILNELFEAVLNDAALNDKNILLGKVREKIS